MKTIYTLILISITYLSAAQTSFTDADISAARGNDYEWLLTNIDYGFSASIIQGYTWAKTRTQPTFGDCGENCQRYYNNIKPFDDSKESVFYYDILLEPSTTLKTHEQIVKKIIIKGDYNRLVSFFTEFWSTTINFDDISPDETASTRFLTDIAVFSFDKHGNPQIIIESTKDR